MLNQNDEKLFFTCFIQKCHFQDNRMTRLILNTDNHGGLCYNHDFQTPPPDQTTARYDHMTNLPRCCPSCPIT